MFSPGKRQKPGIACIFVHGGAGFHSIVNEDLHMRACNDAASAAMALMKAGGSAVDAVELAVKVLEDREITNAGFGSNLTIDGVVECDAVIVDRLGRSGAAGAVAQIKNPISLARLLLDRTTQTLSLRRVPPNLLVGRGAADFAYENGMSILPYDCLISPTAKSRWQTWRSDLRRVREQNSGHSSLPPGHPYFERESEMSRQSHTRTMLDSVWNEAQPISPPPSDNKDPHSLSPPLFHHTAISDSPGLSSQAPDEDAGIGIDHFGPGDMRYEDYCPALDRGRPGSAANSTFGYLPSNTDDNQEFVAYSNSDVLEFIDLDSFNDSLRQDGSASSSRSVLYDRPPPSRSSIRSEVTSGTSQHPVQTVALNDSRVDYQSPACHSIDATSSVESSEDTSSLHELKSDRVTDTVGAIAIDLYGNIACGASSGGIGMKHRGRVGPAALIGAGAAVIPVDPDDTEEELSVASVTSGTGEHIGTTMAAKTCSERVYEGRRKVKGGHFEDCADDEAIVGFVQSEFLKHPSVANSSTKGELGILTVKKTKSGIYFYYAHTTQSFAIASFRSDERSPSSTMSRNRGGVIAQGGRSIRPR